WLARTLNLSKDDLFKLSSEDMQKNGGSGLLEHHKGSVSRALDAILEDGSKSLICFLLITFVTDEKIPQWLFKKSRKDWKDPTLQKQFLDWLAAELGISEQIQWYKVSKKHFLEKGGGGLLEEFKHYSFALESVYPQYQWLPWQFEKTPVEYWEDPSHQVPF